MVRPVEHRVLRHSRRVLIGVVVSLAGCHRGDEPDAPAGSDAVADRGLGSEAAVVRSVESFWQGDQLVFIDFGSSDRGERLRYIVIRAFADAAPGQRVTDPRFDDNVRGVPRVRHPDGVMRPVLTDGRAYLFLGDELRTMRVEMNQLTDTSGLSRAGSLEGMWHYLQQFRVVGAD